jgi:deferrochelatase/peroxidase EfeB
MIGRWPSGAPLVKFPDADPGVLSDDDDFGYQPDDVLGQKCPFGSHMRRSNPRDAFEDNNSKKSIKLTNKHRIIRRGRSYGEPLVSTPTDHHAKGDIGLHFMCFNADISNQFEFIMHTWCNFPRFGMLYNDPDPIIGVSDVPEKDRQQNFTVQEEPVNKTSMDLRRFVTIRGGAYFFFPSITAIKYFSTI